MYETLLLMALMFYTVLYAVIAVDFVTTLISGKPMWLFSDPAGKEDK